MGAGRKEPFLKRFFLPAFSQQSSVFTLANKSVQIEFSLHSRSDDTAWESPRYTS